MSSTSSVPQIQFTPTGPIIPTESAVLAGVQADMNAAFGGGLNPSLKTPQGQLATSTTAIIASKNGEIATIVNQVDPQYAANRWQDGIGRIYFLTRIGATGTAVVATLGGLPGTPIPAGTLAQDTSGNTYASTADAVIGVASTVDVEFQNIVTGPIACASGTLTKVYQSISGWDTITNAAAGTLGVVVESQADFEYRRQNSVQLNANGTPGAIYANVFDVANVLDCYVIDNPTNSPVTKGATSYSVAANSVYVAVVGGVAQDIAQAIWEKKDLGCSMNGNTTATVQDTSGYNYPYPTYTMIWETPAALPIYFTVNIQNNASLPSDIVSLAQQAVIVQFTGSNGNQRERIGSTILSGRYYAPVAMSAPNVVVETIYVGTTSAPSSGTSVAVGIDQTPVIAAGQITVNLV